MYSYTNFCQKLPGFATFSVTRIHARFFSSVTKERLKKDNVSSKSILDNYTHPVYSWLKWAPPIDSACSLTLHKYFPGAVPGQVILSRSAASLSKFGLTPENTLYGQSICPDEINNEDDDLGPMMAKYWGECFPMGGIGGAPFVGKTGFGAFAAHVPQDGHVLILFGPHIAISDEGELGKYLRLGQADHSTACGAVIGAYNSCVSNDIGEFDMYDMQQCWIKEKVVQRLESITFSENPFAKLINVAYDCVQEKMLNIINTDFGTGYLILIGGIQINMPMPYEDHFQPLMFTIQSNDMSPIDLLSEFNFESSQTNLESCSNTQDNSSEVFSWFNWSPPTTSPCFKALHKAFPGALPGEAIHRRSTAALQSFGLDADNTVYAQSICPDEINSEDGTLSRLLAEEWGEVFHMGGIGGIPFIGTSGFSMFSNRVPDDGHILIMFGPHLCISEEGKLGESIRQGKTTLYESCDSIINAYHACEEKKAGHFDPYDMQQSWLREKIATQFDKIQSSEDPTKALFDYSYECVKDKLLKIVNTDFGNGKLVLLGGIQINMPAPYKDHFQPLMFEVHSENTDPIDLMPELMTD